jgi:hypothetical protein
MKDQLRGQSRRRVSHAARTAAGSQIRPWMSVPLLVGAMLAALALSGGSEAQDGAEANETRNCVDLMRIDRTEVVDDDTVLFYMRNGTVYRNELTSSCPTLGFEERFMYRTVLTQLCDIDVITVLQDVGFGFMPTASCGLGKFEPIDEDTAEELVAEADREQSRG